MAVYILGLDFGSSSGGYGYGGVAPTYGAPTASYGAPATTYGAPVPKYGAPVPTYGAPVPSYAAPPSTYSRRFVSKFIDFFKCLGWKLSKKIKIY